MASNNGDDVVENLLQCAVCMESYEESGPQTPKMLPCQHSFCVQCLKNISRAGRIQCPSCREQFSTSVDELSRSLVLIQLLDTRGSSPRRNNVTDANLSILLKEKFRDPDNAKEYLSKLIEKILRVKKFNLEEIEAVLNCIQYYRIPSDKSRSIQIIATKFVMYSISFGGGAVTVHLLSEVATELIKTMGVFNDDKLSSEVLLLCLAVLALPAMMNKSSFSNLDLAHLLMTILTTNQNSGIERKFVEFLTNIPRKLSRSDNAIIGNRKYVENLLSILRKKTNTSSRDATFYNLLALLTSLTDETPSTCTNIVNAGGLRIFAELLEDNDPRSNKGVLMNLNNLTEVPEICYHFLNGNSDAVECLLKFMNSDEIHYNCVMEWSQRPSVICFYVSYRSFKPFYPLLQRYDAPPLQLFAVWTIWEFCSFSSDTYQEMLIKEQGIDYLLELNQNLYVDKNVKKFAELTIKLIHLFGK
ncbi:protein zyg-11 homolog B-like isoform X4 [Styela clava]